MGQLRQASEGCDDQRQVLFFNYQTLQEKHLNYI